LFAAKKIPREEISMPQIHNRKAHNHKTRNRRRLTAPLPEALNSHLRDYAEAAKGASRAEATWILSGVTVSAVGLGVLALPQVGNAEVVFTPANQSINEHTRKLKIDFNHDGIPEAILSVQGYCNSGSGFRECFGSIFAIGLHGNQAMTSGGGFASAAEIGKVIGQQDKFQDFPEMAKCRSEFDAFNQTSTHTSKGPWLNVKSRYLGFKFKIDGETHYGWARLTTQGFPCYPSARLTGYAYETIANRPIVTGIKSEAEALMMPVNDGDGVARQGREYASLGMLAVGAPGLEIWRKPSEE
jgi:hypothetical protein